MTYSYPNRTLSALFAAMYIILAGSGTISAQTTTELIFKNASLDSGRAANDGAIYRFASVQSGVDALVKFTGRSSSLVKPENIPDNLLVNVPNLPTPVSGNKFSGVVKEYAGSAAVVSSFPVKLINWNATYNNNLVTLKWATTREINASHFIIERSTDGTEYMDAAMIFTGGNSETLINYSYKDKIPGGNSGVLYYRLRSVDMDGRSTVSDTRIIRLGAANANTVKMATYPNPVQSELRITVPAGWQDKPVACQLVNTNGQMMKLLTIGHAGQTEVMQMNEIPTGMYIVKVVCGNETGAQVIAKQ